MDTRLFARFVAVVEHGSLNKAAQSLNLSQPALSKSIQALEAAFGVPLLHRGASGVSPTEFGRVVFDRFQLVEAELDNIQTEINALRDVLFGRVTIGVPPGPGFISRVMAPAINGLNAGNIPVAINMIIGSRMQLLPALKRGELDILVADLTADPPGELTEEPLFADRHVIVVRAGHPLAPHGEVDLDGLMGFRWIVSTETADIGNELLTTSVELGASKSNETIRSNSSLFIKLLLTESNGVGLIARDAVAEELARGEYVELRLRDAGPRASAALRPRRIGFLYRGDAALSAASRALMGEVRRICAGLEAA